MGSEPEPGGRETRGVTSIPDSGVPRQSFAAVGANPTSCLMVFDPDHATVLFALPDGALALQLLRQC